MQERSPRRATRPADYTGTDDLDFGRQVLHLEADALIRMADRMGKEFERAVELLDSLEGKVVTSGVGKSGIAARKIAATLTSIGCPAVFLHPTEAVHGDLGIVDRRDVVLAISNSGESEELTSMLPALTERGVCLISLTGNPASQLGRLATLVLDTSIEREACPLNLAPTTSVVAAIAMGDAVAMALQKRRGLAPEQYALNHPGGRLGKRLTLRVRDIISWKSSPLPVVPPESGLMQILGEITAGFVGATTVCNAQEELLGIITDNDVRRAMQSNGPASFALQASSIMTAAPSVVLSPDQLAYEALQIMEDRERPVSAAPVVEASGRCIAMIHVHDLVRCGL